MTPIDPAVAAGVLLLLLMAGVTTAVGVYLLVTNPPEDEAAFVGLGKEKVSDDTGGRE